MHPVVVTAEVVSREFEVNALASDSAISVEVSIIGRKGSNGSDSNVPGPPGADGADGVDGAAGANGTNGTNGIDGIDGADGAQGLQGIQGIQGVPGNDGADGSALTKAQLIALIDTFTDAELKTLGELILGKLQGYDGGVLQDLLNDSGVIRWNEL